MDQSFITQWLRQTVRSQITINVLGGLALLVAGIGVLGLTWGFTYIVSLFASGPWLGYHHRVHSVAGLVLIPALFWGNARTPREYLSEYSVTVGGTGDTVVNFYLPGAGMVSNVNPLAPDTLHTGVKMITDCLYSGPRLVMSAFGMFGRSHRLRKLDVDGCGAVIAVLFAARRKLSFQEIVESVGGLDPAAVFPQLHLIDGVIFLAAPPPGITLSQELRETLSRAR